MSMTYEAYRRRNSHAVRELQSKGVRASSESLAGGFYDVNVPVEGGYHISLAQDLDGDGRWSAGVYHRSDGEHLDPQGKPYSAQPYYDLELGHAHPKDVPDLVKKAATHFAPRIGAHMRAQRQNPNLGPQFGS